MKDPVKRQTENDLTPHPPSPEGKGAQATFSPLPPGGQGSRPHGSDRWGGGTGEGSYGFPSHPLLSSLLSGLLLGLAFPPLPGFLAWVGLVPLLCLIDGGCARKAFRRGYLSGVAFNVVALYWIAYLTPLGALAAVLYLPAYVGLFAVAMTRLVRRFGAPALWGAPAVWTAIEYLRSLGELGFPWTALGHTQTRYLPLIQHAEWTGVYGVSFWVVAVNVVLLRVTQRWPEKRLCFILAAALAGLFALPAAYGLWRIPAGPLKGTLSVGVVQPNLSPMDRWQPDGVERTYETLFRMTREAAARGARLIVWPETAVPTTIRTQRERRRLVQGLADSLNVSILTGAPDYVEATGMYYNAAFLFRPGREDLPRYDKMHLVPFGEAMPYGDVFPVLRKVSFTASGFTSGDFGRGRERTLFEGPEGRFAALICFESVFPHLVRGMVKRRPDFLVNITNDAWFGATSSPYQHAEIGVLRAVENRVAIARCATTGVSTFIDPFGRQSQTTGIFRPAVLVDALPRREGETFYTRYGDLFAQGCVAFTLVGMIGCFPTFLARARKVGQKKHAPSNAGGGLGAPQP
ncbi:MAG: apolipoprotein N-acyltransferase [Candidatus Handelsmanbacteria bacterium RIFCSPLOWO2_12_FULL_64_10]|uniref:Apolipoprotein N-acyltransferase n=1 Tax=Handelsmanbacteria sp. (strain RIFCSPLOWO2_12_FULL_64_10) TaxID=1817868 RepID=A0A1F6CBF4_HANXR|nr:MAG: apolipoprotein N-acyltransferase [Candidatus Handelsmanbacteria bacterium RIFCSPLOWO2_12_FULL_64_10]